MSITRFIPEIWSAQLLVAYQRAHVYAALCNRDWEGEIKAAGDTVRITSISRPNIKSYNRNSDIEYEELTDAQRTLVVDQEKYWAFGVDDVDKAQARGNVVPQAMREAAFGMRDQVDTYIGNLYTGAASANVIGTTAITTGEQAYTGIRKLMLKLSEANVPDEDRWVVVPHWYSSLLLEDKRFTDLSASGSSEPLLNGKVGRALGATIYSSNNTPNPSGDDNIVMAGTRAAMTMAEQITETEALRSEARFADRVRGLMVYGAKLLRPEGIAVLTASQT